MNCPICKRYFDKKAKVIEHLEKQHPETLNGDMDASQMLYYSTHGSINGICMCGCGQPTQWNFKTGKPFKVSPDPKCKERISNKADKNMLKAYHTTTLLRDMTFQKKMQTNRPTAGKYKFPDGGEVDYLSKLEKNFLWYLGNIMDFTSNMVLDGAPYVFQYKDGDVTRNYMPDYYLPDYNLLVEIKEGGDSPNTNPAYIKETKYKEALKDDVMKKQTQYNYIKVVNCNYGPFMEALYNIVQLGKDDTNPKRNAVVVITESACVDLDETVSLTEATTFPGMYLLVSRVPGTSIISRVSVSESAHLARLYIGESESIVESTLSNTVFNNSEIDIYRYTGDKARETLALNRIIGECGSENEFCHTMRILDIITECGINYTLGASNSNNKHHVTDFVKVDTIPSRWE